jgi:hypothetical protein
MEPSITSTRPGFPRRGIRSGRIPGVLGPFNVIIVTGRSLVPLMTSILSSFDELRTCSKRQRSTPHARHARHARHEYSRWSTRGGVLAVAVSTCDGGDCFGPNDGPRNDRYGCHSTLSCGTCHGYARSSGHAASVSEAPATPATPATSTRGGVLVAVLRAKRRPSQ